MSQAQHDALLRARENAREKDWPGDVTRLQEVIDWHVGASQIVSVDLDDLTRMYANIPDGPYSADARGNGWEVRALDADPTNKHHWPYRLCASIPGQQAGCDPDVFGFIAGVINAWPQIAAALATHPSPIAADAALAYENPKPEKPERDFLTAPIDEALYVDFSKGTRAVEGQDNVAFLRKWAEDIRRYNGVSIDADRLDAIADTLLAKTADGVPTGAAPKPAAWVEVAALNKFVDGAKPRQVWLFKGGDAASGVARIGLFAGSTGNPSPHEPTVVRHGYEGDTIRADERAKIVALIRVIAKRFEKGSASQNNHRALADAIESGHAFPLAGEER